VTKEVVEQKFKGEGFQFKLMLTNGTAAPVSYVLMGVSALGPDQSFVRLNPYPLPASAPAPAPTDAKTPAAEPAPALLPYQSKPGLHSLLDLSAEPIPPDEVRQIEFYTPVDPKLNLSNMSGIGTEVLSAGGPEVLLSLVSSLFIPPTERERAALLLSAAKKEQYPFLADDGKWTIPSPAPAAPLPPASAEAQAYNKGLGFKRSKGGKAKVATIVLDNAGEVPLDFYISGQGKTQVVRTLPEKKRSLNVEPGLTFIALTGELVAPATGVLALDANATYSWTFGVMLPEQPKKK
jgi:hypothetical protein